MKKAYAYARYSSDNQREESIDAQLRAIREFAEREGYTIVEEYTDEAKSATTDKRPAFQRMISDAANKEVSAVFVHKLDRFSRDRYDSAFYKRELKKNGVRLISVLERLDDSPEAIILESVLEGMSEYYSRNLAREVMKGMSETAYQCKHTGGMPPLGYSVNADKTYSIVPEEADTVRLIFRMYADGKGYSDILAALRDRRTKIGQSFAKNSLSSILRNEKYIGTFVFNRTERKTAGKRNNHKNKPESEIIRIAGGMPRIVDDETWGAVQKRLSDNTRNASNTAKVCYILSGKIFCGACGARFVGKTKPAGRSSVPWSYYVCSNRDHKKTCDMRIVSASIIEGAVIDLVERLIDVDLDATADRIEAELQKYIDSMPQSRRNNEEELKRIQAQKAHIVIAVRDGAPYSMFSEEVERISERERELTKELGKTEDPLGIRKDMIRRFLEQHKGIRNKTREEQKRIIAALIDRITIYDDHADVESGSTVYQYRMDGSVPPPPMGYYTNTITILKVALLSRCCCNTKQKDAAPIKGLHLSV